MIRCRRMVVAALTILIGGSGTACASAATKAGVSMPDEMQIDGTTVQLNGLGLRSFTILHIHGYVGGLYLAKKTNDADEAMSEPGPKALVIHYIRGASQSQVHQLYMDSSRRYCAQHACTDADKAAFETLLDTLQPVKPGDRSSFLIDGDKVRVLFDDRQVALLKDPGFGRAILESDLGPNPPSTELKEGLLGRDGDS